MVHLRVMTSNAGPSVVSLKINATTFSAPSYLGENDGLD
jgi:hypothetical protein